jgi:hypothetical protein
MSSDSELVLFWHICIKLLSLKVAMSQSLFRRQEINVSKGNHRIIVIRSQLITSHEQIIVHLNFLNSVKNGGTFKGRYRTLSCAFVLNNSASGLYESSNEDPTHRSRSPNPLQQASLTTLLSGRRTRKVCVDNRPLS